MNVSLLLPQIFLSGGMLGVLACGIGPTKLAAYRVPLSRLLTIGVLALALVSLFSTGRNWPPNSLIRLDGLTFAWQGLFFAATLPVAWLITADNEVPFALLLGIVLGMSLMAVANHLFLLFMGLEMMSLSIYMLLYALKPDARALEAAVKYFFSGAAAAGLYLLGLAIYYAGTGQMALEPFRSLSSLAVAGIFLMASAALFKIGAFPLHFWLPDAYEAAPPELAGFMSTVIKAGGFLLLMRILSLIPAGSSGSLLASLPWIAAFTMTLGNFLALRQENLQRLLAYSSISHAGYMVAAVWASLSLPGMRGQGTLYLYLLAYLFTSMGSFLFLKYSQVSTRTELRGMAARSPRLAGFMTLMVLSLAGIPPTAIFLAKLYVFLDVIRARGWWLVAVIAVNSIVAMGYYFPILRTMTVDASADTAIRPAEISWTARWTLALCVVGTVAIGLWPGIRNYLSLVLAI